jgi:hypothetical protein
MSGAVVVEQRVAIAGFLAGAQAGCVVDVGYRAGAARDSGQAVGRVVGQRQATLARNIAGAVVAVAHSAALRGQPVAVTGVVVRIGRRTCLREPVAHAVVGKALDTVAATAGRGEPGKGIVVKGLDRRSHEVLQGFHVAAKVVDQVQVLDRAGALVLDLGQLVVIIMRPGHHDAVGQRVALDPAKGHVLDVRGDVRGDAVNRRRHCRDAARIAGITTHISDDSTAGVRNAGQLVGAGVAVGRRGGEAGDGALLLHDVAAGVVDQHGRASLVDDARQTSLAVIAVGGGVVRVRHVLGLPWVVDRGQAVQRVIAVNHLHAARVDLGLPVARGIVGRNGLLITSIHRFGSAWQGRV